MGRRRKGTVTDEQRARIHANKARGLSQRDNAMDVGVSLGTVNAVLADAAKTTPAQTTPPPTPAPPPAQTTTPTLDDAKAGAVASLVAAADELRAATARAREAGDTARVIAAARAAAQVATLISKLPAEQPALDEQDQMVALAKKARERLHDLFDRYLEAT